jgi:hypothetical protein
MGYQESVPSTMKTFLVTTLVCFLFQSLTGVVHAAGNGTLPNATFDDISSSWFITVPETWNYTTILDLTNRVHAVDDPNALLANLPFPHTTPPDVYINGTWSGYATNSLNYALLERLLNDTAVSYSEDNWVLPVVCEWPISAYC